ncbi:MAG: MmgE/PrpD family protein [Thaumarchaeota archaeon]|nr:MmgE/PrpD family protein [Nitrososphaerota archaeon]
MTIAEYLSDYAHSLQFSDLPKDVIHETKRRVIDSLGCAIGAFDAEPCRIARKVVPSIQNGATIIGTSKKTLPDLAAFANGSMIRYLDCNDTYLSKEPAHPSDNIAAALAVAETENASGKDLITAIVLAYEIQCRLCDAASLRSRGWDHVTYGAFSTSLCSAKLMKLSEKSMKYALGLAGVANIALRQTRVGELSMWKGCAFANTARNGVFAALLAREGMTGPAPIFEGEKGFMKLVSGQFRLYRFGGDNAPFKILETYIKHFPVEYHAQSAVEAALELRRELQKKEGKNFISSIKSIEIQSFDAAIEIIGSGSERWDPRTRETADHSLPYCVAVALMDGTITVNSFSLERIRDKKLYGLLQKVVVVEDKEFTKTYPQKISNRLIVQTYIRRYAKQVDYPKGHPKNYMSDKELEEKFRSLTSRRLSKVKAEKILHSLWNLEKKYIGDIMSMVKVN